MKKPVLISCVANRAQDAEQQQNPSVAKVEGRDRGKGVVPIREAALRSGHGSATQRR